MKCSVFIATSADGYIATETGDVDWLDKAGNPDADMGEFAGMGFNAFIDSIDCMIMGRKSMEKISSFDLDLDQWPYGNLPIFVLSRSLKELPENMEGKVALYDGDIPTLLKLLEKEDLKHAYIDGGATITSFLNQGLIDEMIITRAPILLGAGIPLFGKLDTQLNLIEAEAQAFPNDFIQVKYKVKYP